MIRLSNGMEFKDAHEVRKYIDGMRITILHVEELPVFSYLNPAGLGKHKAKSTAIAAIEASIENAELALKSAQQKEAKMKAVKKAVKTVAKKPAVKKPAVKKPVAKKATGKKK